MRKLFVSCVLVSCVLMFASDASEGTLTGVLTDFTGAVVARASVRIQHWETEKAGHPILKEDSLLQSDAYGRYSINVKPGLYDVFISFPGFSPVAQRVKVEAGKVADFSLKLKLDRTSTFVE